MKTVTVDDGLLLDIERILWSIAENRMARIEVEFDLELAGFNIDIIDAALEAVQKLNGTHEPKQPSGKAELAEFVGNLMKEPAKTSRGTLGDSATGDPVVQCHFCKTKAVLEGKVLETWTPGYFENAEAAADGSSEGYLLNPVCGNCYSANLQEHENGEVYAKSVIRYTVQVASNADAFQSHRRLSYTVEAVTPEEAVMLAAAQHAASLGMVAHTGPAINVSGGENAKWGVGPWSCWIKPGSTVVAQ